MARTGVGVSADGSRIYLVFAGPSATSLGGLTLVEFAQLFRNLSSSGGTSRRRTVVQSAVALSDGDDASFVYDGRLLNTPTSVRGTAGRRFEHHVANQLAVSVSGGPSPSGSVPWPPAPASPEVDRDCANPALSIGVQSANQGVALAERRE
jgi:hypothetical protein